MSGFIDLRMNELLDEYWGGDTPATPPATWYIALFTTAPAADGTGGVEAAFSGYARQASSNDLTEWPAAAAGVKANGSVIDYGVAGSGPTAIVAFGFYDDPTAGDLWFVVPATGSPISIPNAGDASFAVGSIVIDRCA